MKRRGHHAARRAALSLLAILLLAAPAHAADPARLLAAALREVAAISDVTTRTRTAIEIARLEAAAGLTDHARAALRQTADSVWRSAAAARGLLLAETAEAQCALGARDDAAKVLAVAGPDAGPPRTATRLLRAALFCQDRQAATAIEARLSDMAGAEAAIALAESGLPSRAEAAWRRLDAPTRQRIAPDVARGLAAYGHVAAARRIDPGFAGVTPAVAVPTLLAEARLRREAGARDEALAFLAIATGFLDQAPGYAPALAEAYADADDRAAAARLIAKGDESLNARAALAAAHARAGDVETARRLAAGLQGAAGARAQAALARAADDAEAADAAARHAEAAPQGAARAVALAFAALAVIDR